MRKTAHSVDPAPEPRPMMRWTPRRKEAVVVAIESGILSRPGALLMYGLSEEELGGWERLYAQAGKKALQATRLQNYLPRERRKEKV